MKKIIAMIAAVLISASVLAGCSKKNDNSSKTEGNNNSTAASVQDYSNSSDDSSSIEKIDETINEKFNADKKLLDGVKEKLKNDVHLSLSASMNVSDKDVTMTFDVAIADGGKKTYIAMDMMGIKTRSIIKDGYTYTLKDSTKKFAKKEGSVSSTNIDLIKTDGLQYVESAKVTVNGKNLIRETYKNASSVNTNFYFDGNKLLYITTDQNGSPVVMTVNTLSSKIPDGIFDVPSDYTEGDVTPDMPATK